MDSKYTVDYQDGIIRIELVGRLDANNAPALQDELKQMAGKPVSKMLFFAKDLEYVSSAGLRALIFAKQKIGVDANAFLIGAQEAVLNVIKMSGLDNFLEIQDKE